jgi:hypothetical protein
MFDLLLSTLSADAVTHSLGEAKQAATLKTLSVDVELELCGGDFGRIATAPLRPAPKPAITS